VGDVLPYRGAQVIDLAVRFPTPYGERILLSGFPPSMLATFLSGELRRIPGVSGAHNYLIDDNDTVIASDGSAYGTGYRFTQPAQVNALSRSSADRDGRYYDEVRVNGSTWRIVLSAPDGPLFASVSGFRKWVPWLIFIAFALVAAAALALGRRLVRSAESDLREANAQLETVNEELVSMNDQLESRAVELSRSNAELEQFASIAAHDLQEPLRKVRTFTERVMVMESERLSEKGAEYLGRANRAAERMQKLVQDLLRFSRVTTQARPFAPVDLEQLMRETLDDLSLEIERAGAVVRVGSLPTISADPLQMHQLLQNLISNALKFRRAGVTPEVSVHAANDCGMVRLVVRDNGIGFEHGYRERIFRIFERLHARNEFPGTGIGLALCRKIVERHGGRIVAEGEPGVGAVFIVTLPIHHDGVDVVTPATDGELGQREREEAATGA
jgi:signal transduction histidine kinase